MQITMEKVALIAVSLATTAGVAAFLFNLISPTIQLASVNSVSNVFSVTDFEGKRWFNALIATEFRINSITPLDSACHVDTYELRTDAVIVYGYCDGNPPTVSFEIETPRGILTVTVPLG